MKNLEEWGFGVSEAVKNMFRAPTFLTMPTFGLRCFKVSWTLTEG